MSLKLPLVKEKSHFLKMLYNVAAFLLLAVFVISEDQSTNFDFNYLNLKDDIYDQQAQFMSPKKNPHEKASVESTTTEDPWAPFDFSQFDAYLTKTQDGADNNRVKRHAKRHHVHGRRRNKLKSDVVADSFKNISTTSVPIGRKGDTTQRKPWKNRRGYYESESNLSSFVEMPKDLYQAHLRPGVIFRIHMSEAILKMQYRNYAEDKDESVIEADVEYLRLTRKVISDEITKFEDLQWLMGWFENRSDLIHEHTCNTRYYTVGTPPTKFSGPEEYMKRACLFDSVYVDQMPYVVGEDGSLLAAVAPPVLHCDAATCTSVPFIDSLMFEEQYGLTNVRTITRCQANCRAHCKNDADCLKRCSDRCLRTD